MPNVIDRRSLLRIAGASLGFGALYRFAPAAEAAEAKGLFALLGRKNGEEPKPFTVVQLSDTHVGFEGPPNPLGTKAFEAAVDAINLLPRQPDLVLFTGDLTHDSEKEGEHAIRMKRFREIAGRIRGASLRFVPGEHDAGLDGGVLYRSFFGETHMSFDHRGVHFVGLDNVSLGKPVVGPAQLAWLKADLGRFTPTTPVVVFTHRPLFDLAPDWEWYTGDGDEVMKLLAPFSNVTVLYGHIHRRHEKREGTVRHFAARSLTFGFPDPETGAGKKPLPFDKDHPYRNLGLREIRIPKIASGQPAELRIEDTELSSQEFDAAAGMQQLLKGDSFA